jgi:GT2 family glycosyltransferase
VSAVELVETSANRRSPRAAARPQARLDFACRLPGDLIVLEGSTAAGLSRIPGYRESTTALTVRPAITFATGPWGDVTRTGFLSLIEATDVVRRRRLVLGPVRLTLDQATLDDKLVSSTELAMRLSGLDPDSRHRCLDLLTCTLRMVEGPVRIPLAKTLFEIRETLRERLPASYVDERVPKALHIDALFAVDDRSFYVRGWMRDAEAEISSLVALSPEGRSVDLTGRLIRYSRPDVTALYGSDRGSGLLGFIGYFELPAPSVLKEGWTFLMADGAGGAVEAPAPPTVDEPIEVRTALMGDLVHDPMSERLLWQHTFPAVSRVQERLAATVKIADVCQYGAPPPDPTVSIVVPLYRRIDFVQYQLAQFLHDGEMRSADLIYVLDSPEMAGELTASARQLWGLYAIPFRIVVLDRNGGFSAANNLGASVARAPKLLLMNSDVLPKGPGWLSAMARFYDATGDIGALGPKLVYEDGSLQHAGLYYRRSDETGCWHNAHHFQGLSGEFPPANVRRPVAGVTGACLMVDRDLFQQVGGLRGIYVQGDFEDSDLNLRIAELGKTNWYLPEVELYHLEGQSYPNELRRMTFRYNAWLHSVLWGDRIKELTNGPATSRRPGTKRRSEGVAI